jgi:hypothetical protein
MKDLLANWKKRHRNRTSFWLHMVGIPSSFAAAPVLLALGKWWLALAALAAGYAVQLLGHLIEGNRSGEEQLLRRLLGGALRPRSKPRHEG